ncbi:MAG: DNA polymerase III subunit gamma/tau [Pirellulaceae bacterium]
MNSPSTTASDKYQVVARRYRPQSFGELVGQTQVATALQNAIEQNRVGHAYLFTGARGVGKTSSARIFAKCLNCQQGSTIEACGKCDICEGIATGEDVDVLEIDGASNRGIDEIRQLRANANVRPSRARYKIYIIDEVHMLTGAAFNALLKTLEEPPDHVKFIFCTTDPEKIPITVLSRCQRFDFPPIKTRSIVDRLRLIVDKEQIAADDQALELLARRAGGSMRDSQSLLEQLLSYATSKITVEEVHALLGTADNEAVFDIADAIVAGDSAGALAQVHEAIESGVDAGQLTEQLLGLFRDAMACLVGCSDELMLYSSSDDGPRLEQLASSLGVEKVLALLQVLDQTLVKVRHSTWVRTLLETAVVRSCHLQDIDQIPALIRQLQSGETSAGNSTAAASASRTSVPKPSTAKKKELVAETATPPPPAPQANPQPLATAINLEPGNLATTWNNLLAEIGDLTSDAASNFESIQLQNDRLQVVLKSKLDHDMCNRPEPRQRLETALQEATGKKLRIDFQLADRPEDSTTTPRPVHVSKRQRVKQMEQQEFIKTAMELFDAEITDVQPPRKGKS